MNLSTTLEQDPVPSRPLRTIADYKQALDAMGYVHTGKLPRLKQEWVDLHAKITQKKLQPQNGGDNPPTPPPLKTIADYRRALETMGYTGKKPTRLQGWIDLYTGLTKKGAPPPTQTDHEPKTIKEYVKVLQDLGHTGISKLRKPELIKLYENRHRAHDKPNDDRPGSPAKPKTVLEYKNAIIKLGYKDKMPRLKQDLVALYETLVKKSPKQLSPKSLTPKSLSPKRLSPKSLSPKRLSPKGKEPALDSESEPEHEPKRQRIPTSISPPFKDFDLESDSAKSFSKSIESETDTESDQPFSLKRFKTYKIEAIRGDGNCFFSAIAAALHSVYDKIDHTDIRQQLAQHLTPDIVNDYNELYTENRISYDKYKARILKDKEYVTDYDLVKLFPLAFPTIGLVIMKHLDSDTKFVCTENLLENKMYFIFLKFVDYSKDVELGTGHYDLVKINNHKLVSYPDFPDYILNHLKTQCVTIQISPYRHTLFKSVDHQIRYFPFAKNIQCISNHLFSHEYDTLGHMIESQPKVDFDIVNAHQTIRHAASPKSNDARVVLFQSIGEHYDGIEFVQEVTHEHIQTSIACSLKDTIPLQFHHTWHPPESFVDCIHRATHIPKTQLCPIDQFGDHYPYFGLILCTPCSADKSRSSIEPRYRVTLQPSEQKKLYYIILRDDGQGQYELMEYKKSTVLNPSQIFEDIVKHLKLDVTTPYGDAKLHQYIKPNEYAIRYSQTGSYDDLVENEAQTNVIVYNVHKQTWSCTISPNGSTTVMYLIQTPPSHYDELVLKKDVDWQGLCESVAPQPSSYTSKTVGELQAILREKNVKNKYMPRNRDDLIQVLEAPPCSPEDDQWCDKDKICDLRYKVCLDNPKRIKTQRPMPIDVDERDPTKRIAGTPARIKSHIDALNKSRDSLSTAAQTETVHAGSVSKPSETFFSLDRLKTYLTNLVDLNAYEISINTMFEKNN